MSTLVHKFQDRKLSFLDSLEIMLGNSALEICLKFAPGLFNLRLSELWPQ